MYETKAFCRKNGNLCVFATEYGYCQITVCVKEPPAKMRTDNQPVNDKRKECLIVDTKAFKKACFDLVTECNNMRATDPDVISKLVKEDDDGLWIRFTAIGSLLDYCEKNETESVLRYCLEGVLFAMIMEDLVKRDRK